MIEDAIWESEFCRDFEPVQVSKALGRHGMLNYRAPRFTYIERFEGDRNKRFHVITAKVLTSDYVSTPEEAAGDDDGVPQRPQRPRY